MSVISFLNQVIAVLVIICLTVSTIATPAFAFNQSDLDQLEITNNCERCDLKGADLEGADLQGANLTGADLTDAILVEADLTNTILKDANLKNAILLNAKVDSTALKVAKLNGTTVPTGWVCPAPDVASNKVCKDYL